MTRYGFRSENPISLCEDDSNEHNGGANSKRFINQSNRFKFNPFFCIDTSNCTQRCCDVVRSNAKDIDNLQALYAVLKENDCLGCLHTSSVASKGRKFK